MFPSWAIFLILLVVLIALLVGGYYLGIYLASNPPGV